MTTGYTGPVGRLRRDRARRQESAIAVPPSRWADLDAESVAWLEQHLGTYPGTVVAVTHDRYFLDDVAGDPELDRGHAYPYAGNYSTYLETKAARLRVEGQRDARLRKRLEDELAWVRSSPRARQAKSRSRLDRYEQMAAEAASRAKLDFEEVQILPGPRLGSLVVEADHLVKGFGDRMLIDGLSFSLPPNGIAGVIGPNGIGKTTLLKMILGEEQPDAGTITVGETVRVSYVDQLRAGIDPGKTVWEVISGGQAHSGRAGRDPQRVPCGRVRVSREPIKATRASAAYL